MPGIVCRAGEAAHIRRKGAVDPAGWHGAGAEKLERIRGDELRVIEADESEKI